MATYKVLQDIEADDKLLGPFSLKQFIFAGITIGIGVAMFFIATNPLPVFLKVPLITALLPPMLLFGFLAAPISRDQPNEIWLLARISFLFKPRKRIWNQDGISQLVTITAPKKEVHVYTNNLSQTEVKSRLQALANTVDSRGWAVKNVNTNLFAQPGYLDSSDDSDRLLSPMELPQDVPVTDITAADDILDVSSNSTAQHLDQLVQQSTATQRDKAISGMSTDASGQTQPADYWFLNQPEPAKDVPSNLSTFQNQQVVVPGSTDSVKAAEETEADRAVAEELAKNLKNESYDRYIAHTKTLKPLHDRDGNPITSESPTPSLAPVDPYAAIYGQPQDDNAVPSQPTNRPVTVQPLNAPQDQPQDQGQKPQNPAILGLAHNDDLNVSTIARQAKRISEDDDEVVISLH